jgi:WD40 repeat protein
VSAGVVPGRQLWVSRYNGPSNRGDMADSVAVSPDGATVFVCGSSEGITSQDDYATLACRAAARLWLRRYNGPADGVGGEAAMALGPAGKTVFVTGDSQGTGSQDDLATVAYRAATGRRLWARRDNGPASLSDDVPSSLAISPDGKTVLAAGTSSQNMMQDNYTTIAYNTATGSQRWISLYHAPAGGINEALALAAGPNGTKVLVTGVSAGDYATIAYDSATGSELWTARYNGSANAQDYARALAVGPRGARVFVTGNSVRAASPHPDFVTVAYRSR